MSYFLRFNDAIIELKGDRELLAYVTRELRPLITGEGGEPSIKIELLKGGVLPPDDMEALGRNVYGRRGELLVLFASKPLSYWTYIKGNELWRISVWARFKVGKLAGWIYKQLSRTYLGPRELLAYLTINGVIEPWYLFLHEGNGALIHASAVEKKGEVTLFTGLRGIGKTTISSLLIFERGYRFLSDDITFLTADGNVVLYPRYLMVYPYSVREVEAMGRKLGGYLGALDKANWRLRSFLLGERGVRRRVSPLVMYGEGKIAKRGELHRVVFLRRGRELKYRELTPEEMALLNLSVLELEYGRYVRLLRLWERSGFSTVKLSDVRRRVYGVYLRAFERAHLYELTLPVGARWEDVIKLIEGLS